MASEISKRIDAAVMLGVAPLLKQRGFRKKGRTFHKNAGEATQVVNVQADKWNEGDHGRFTVNLGVYFHAIAEAVGWPVANGLPLESECTVRTRLGHLLPNPGDKWWTLGGKMEDPAVAREVAEAVENHGLEWLGNVASRAGLRACFASGKGNFHFNPKSPIALEILDGDMAAASALLQARLAKSHNPQFAAQLSAWARERGLI